MATGAGDGGLAFRGVFEGSISGSHLEVDRRPYHKNCTCALHSRGTTTTTANCPHHKPSIVAYPIKRSWSEGSFALYPAPGPPSLNPIPSPSSSPSIDLSKTTTTTTTTNRIPRASSSSTFEFLSSSSISNFPTNLGV